MGLFSPIIRAVRAVRGSSSSSAMLNRRTIIASATGNDHLANPADVLGNPLRNLTPESAATLLQNAMRGQWTKAQWLMYYVEQWDADVWTLVERRCAGLRQLDWTIRIDAQAEERGQQAMAERQRDHLHSVYSQIDNMREAVEFLALAKFRGYSHLGISATHLEPLDQWWWVRDGMYGGWYHNPEAKLTTSDALGEPVDESLYIIREEPRSLIWLAIIKFLRASYNGKWWDKFCEIASRHGTVIIAPSGLSDEQATIFENRAKAIARGGSGVLENGSSVEHTGPEGTFSGKVWEQRLRYLKEDLILAGTGGMLTALSQATGIGGSQGKEQGDVWRTLLRADAGDISEVFQEQLDKPRLAEAFPNQPILAWFELDASETPSTDTVLKHAELASKAGLAIDPEQLSERTGYELSPSTAAVPPAPLGNRRRSIGIRNRTTDNGQRTTDELSSQIAEQLSIPASWSAPVQDALDKLMALADSDQLDAAALADKIEDLQATLPELLGEMDTQALADVFEAALGTAVVASVESSLSNQNRGK